MQAGEYDQVKLTDGSIGTIVEVWEAGKAYEFEIEHPERFDDVSEVWRTIYQDDIAEVTYRARAGAAQGQA